MALACGAQTYKMKYGNRYFDRFVFFPVASMMFDAFHSQRHEPALH